MGKKASKDTLVKYMRVFKQGRLCARLLGIDVTYTPMTLKTFRGPIPYGPSNLEIKMTVAELTPYGKRIIGRALKQQRPIDARLHVRWRAKDKRRKSTGRVTYNLKGLLKKEEKIFHKSPDVLSISMQD